LCHAPHPFTVFLVGTESQGPAGEEWTSARRAGITSASLPWRDPPSAVGFRLGPRRADLWVDKNGWRLAGRWRHSWSECGL